MEKLAIDNEVDNDVSIPFHNGLIMGQAVDFTRQLATGKKLVADGVIPIASKIDSVTCKFSLASAFIHVCDVLDIPPEYALKVESGLLCNEVVKTCLDGIYNKQAFKLIFRMRFIQELHQFTSPVRLEADGKPQPNPESIEPYPGLFETGVERHATRVVEALHIGDELVVIMTISTIEMDTLQKFHQKIEQILQNRFGYLGNDEMLKTIEKLGCYLDDKLSKSHYKNVKCTIQYGSFVDLDECPATAGGVVEIIRRFTNKWEDTMKDAVNINSIMTAMKVSTGTAKQLPGRDDITTTEMAREVFNTRVTLKPLHGDGKAIPKECPQINEAIFSCLYALKKTENLMEDFLTNHSLFSNQDYRLEGEEISNRVLQRKNQLIEAIEGFTLVHPVTIEDKQSVQEMVTDLPDLVDQFIKKVTTKLPKGNDINLLIIGKTGHGKSSSANTILRRKEFSTSSGGISHTKSCQHGWAETDGRTFKVVDVPGICDTDLDSVDSVRLAMKCISEAISTCSEGFHALLLVIRYGNRMTEEEERAIYILKCILGQTIVHSHCICLVTHGDNFEENEGNFEGWCKRQDGFLKEVFEECNYRCVLFNNKTSNPVVLKTQLIDLVSKVDALEHRGTCYTNDIFKHAEKERQRLIEELQLPLFKEEILRNLNLLQNDFDVVEQADESNRKEKLDILKDHAEKLRLKLDEARCGGISDIYQAVSNFSERLHRQEEKELANAQLRLERERFQQKEQQLREEREVVERQVAKLTELRVREAAEAAEKKEREIRELERKKLEEEMRHRQELEETINNMANSSRKKSRWVKFRNSAFKR